MFAPVTDDDVPRIAALINRAYWCSGAASGWKEQVRKDGAYALPVRAGGQDEFFLAVGFPIASRASPPPQASDEEIAEKRKLLATLLSKYGPKWSRRDVRRARSQLLCARFRTQGILR
jgi:hypothetical protein